MGDSKRELGRPPSPVRLRSVPAAVAAAEAPLPPPPPLAAGDDPPPPMPTVPSLAPSRRKPVTYEDAVRIATEWMVNIKEHTHEDVLENTSEFMGALNTIIRTLETHIVQHPTEIFPHDVIEHKIFIRYWRAAPQHHCQFPVGLRLALVEIAWLALAYSEGAKNPTRINAALCRKFTLELLFKRMREMCIEWPLKMEDIDPVNYAKLRDLYISFTIYGISRGIKAMMIAPPPVAPKISRPKRETKDGKAPAAPPPPPPPPAKTASAKTSSSSSSASPEAKTARPKLEDNEINREIARMKANDERSKMALGWIPWCFRTFVVLDHVKMLFIEHPIKTSNAFGFHPFALTMITEKVTEFVAGRIKKTSPTEDFKRILIELAFNMAMPLGAHAHRMRDESVGTSTQQELYRFQIGGDDGDIAVSELRTMATKPYKQTFEGKHEDVKYDLVRSALILHMYAFWIQQRVDGIDFMEDYVILQSQIRQKHSMLTRQLREGIPRGPVIVQIGSWFYIHRFDKHGITAFTRAKNITEALAMWTYHIIYDSHFRLDSGHEIRGRWLEQFLVKKEKKK